VRNNGEGERRLEGKVIRTSTCPQQGPIKLAVKVTVVTSIWDVSGSNRGKAPPVLTKVLCGYLRHSIQLLGLYFILYVPCILS
jgi:hypothetical protein